MSFDRQVSETCKASYFHIRALRHIRSSLTTDACKTIAAAIVGSRLDCAVLSSCWHFCFKLGSPTACSKYTCSGRYRKISFLSHHPRSSYLHWLPVRHRIDFKIATITFKVLQFHATAILSRCPIPRYVPTRSLRSSSSLSICILTRKTAMAKSKSFSPVASYFGNKLPCHLSSISTLPAFKKRLKHHFFRVLFLVIPHHPMTSCFMTSVHPTNATQVRHTPPPG